MATVELDSDDRRVQLIVTRVRVRDGRDRVRVAGKPLCEEEVLRGPVDVCDGRVAEGTIPVYD